MKKPSLRLLLALLCLLPVSAFAHPGEHVFGFAAGLQHPVGGADHMLAMVAVGLWAAQLGGRALWVVPGAFVSMMLAGGILGLSAVSLPFVEQGVLVSVLVLGMLIAGAFRLPLAASGLLVGFFALFHGMAHGAEMPATVGAISYSLGFALATAALHAAGIIGGLAVQRYNAGLLSRLAGCVVLLGGMVMVAG